MFEEVLPYSNSDRSALLLGTALTVCALGAGGAIRTCGDALSVFGLRIAAPAGLGGLHSVLVRLRDGRISGVWVVGGLGAIAVLHSGHATLGLLRRRDGTRARVHCRGVLAVAAHRFAAQVGNAIPGKCAECEQQARDYRNRLHQWHAPMDQELSTGIIEE